jgi:hypothetical protein
MKDSLHTSVFQLTYCFWTSGLQGNFRRRLAVRI